MQVARGEVEAARPAPMRLLGRLLLLLFATSVALAQPLQASDVLLEDVVGAIGSLVAVEITVPDGASSMVYTVSQQGEPRSTSISKIEDRQDAKEILGRCLLPMPLSCHA